MIKVHLEGFQIVFLSPFGEYPFPMQIIWISVLYVPVRRNSMVKILSHHTAYKMLINTVLPPLLHTLARLCCTPR